MEDAAAIKEAEAIGAGAWELNCTPIDALSVGVKFGLIDEETKIRISALHQAVRRGHFLQEQKHQRRKRMEFWKAKAWKLGREDASRDRRRVRLWREVAEHFDLLDSWPVPDLEELHGAYLTGYNDLRRHNRPAAFLARIPITS